jgi:cellulose synthase/poly-beta-1,6-N-acetylglucosamine synthase-like glycosyltransferase
MVSLQVAAYNEPPDMLIETIRSLEAIDYPNFEVVVIDNNTKDPAVWQPVADYCEGRNRVRFVHVDDRPGYTSGALNLVLAEYTHPDAELIGVIDADYLVDPSYLSSVVGYFHDPDPGRRRLAVARGRSPTHRSRVCSAGRRSCGRRRSKTARRPDRGVDRQDRIADRAPALGAGAAIAMSGLGNPLLVALLRGRAPSTPRARTWPG